MEIGSRIPATEFIPCSVIELQVRQPLERVAGDVFQAIRDEIENFARLHFDLLDIRFHAVGFCQPGSDQSDTIRDQSSSDAISGFGRMS